MYNVCGDDSKDNKIPGIESNILIIFIGLYITQTLLKVIWRLSSFTGGGKTSGDSLCIISEEPPTFRKLAG